MNRTQDLTWVDSASGVSISLKALRALDHISRLITLSQDTELEALMGVRLSLKPDQTQEFLAAISTIGFDYSIEGPAIAFGIYHYDHSYPIGYIALKGMNLSIRSTEIGMAILHPHYRGKGYGNIALSLCLSYAISQLEMQKIGAASLLSNQRAIRQLQSMGFKTVSFAHWQMPNGTEEEMALLELDASHFFPKH